MPSTESDVSSYRKFKTIKRWQRRHASGGPVMSDESYLRDHLLSFVDREERARALYESGLAGDPEFADIEDAIASPRGGEYQQLLAALRMPDEEDDHGTSAQDG
jgi:hypothetical protein